MPPWNAAQVVQDSSSSDDGIYRDRHQQATWIVTEPTTASAAGDGDRGSGREHQPGLQ